MWICMEGLQDLCGCGGLRTITIRFGLCSLISITSLERKGNLQSQAQFKLTVLKYTVINHVTGVSPSAVCMLLA